MTNRIGAVREDGFGGVARVGETVISGVIIGFCHLRHVEHRSFDHGPSHCEHATIRLWKWARREKQGGQRGVRRIKLRKVGAEMFDLFEFLRRGLHLLRHRGETREAVRRTGYARRSGL